MGKAPAGMDQSLAGRLVQESKSRQQAKPSVEDVFAMCEQLGAAVPKKEQTMGATYRALYCVGSNLRPLRGGDPSIPDAGICLDRLYGVPR